MNSYPSAAKGVKKIFSAEVLQLIGTLCMSLGSVFLVITGAVAIGSVFDSISMTTVAVFGILGLVFTVSGAIVALIGYIFYLIGIKTAGADETGYNNAFWILIISLVITVISAFVSGTAKTILGLFPTFLDIVALIFVVQATERLLQSRNCTELANQGNTSLNLILIPYLASAVLKLVTTFISAPVVLLVLSIISLIVAIVGYVLYMSFLKKASKNLA